MSQTETIEITPFKEQEPFLWNDKKYYGYISGVGAGKTSAGIIRMMLNMQEWNPGELGAIVAPTTTMIKDVILPELREFGILNHYEYRSQHSDEPGLHAPNGSRALLLSADNRRTVERLRGLNLAWFWIDERTEVPQRAQDILQQRLRVGNYRNGFITTTPNGYDSVYEFFVGDVDGELFKHGQADVLEAPDRLALLRVPSHANPHTPDDYKQQLDADFSGESYEQEVLGEFTTFEGLVHKWFDRQKNVLSYEEIKNRITREERGKVIGDYDRVIYGQDWGFSSDPAGGLVIVVRNGEYFIIDEFKERGLTNQELAKQVQGWYDEHDSGPVYCDPAEPKSIEVFTRNGLDAIKADNSVSEGLQAIKSVSDNLYVAEYCTALINEFGQYRYKDDPKDDSDVVKAHDHLCLAAGTSILTDRGDVRIEEINSDDKVLTRNAFEPIRSHGLTQEAAEVITLQFSDGTELTATPNHPVYVANQGWTYVDALRYGDVCLKTALSSTERVSTRTNAGITEPVDTTGKTESVGSTAKCGKHTTERFQTATLSTTSTGISQTTISKTSNASLVRNTKRDTRTSAGLSPRNITKRWLKGRKGGIGATRGESGIANTPKSHGRTKRPKKRSVSSVETPSSITPLLSSAQTRAKPNTAETPALTTKSGSASSVATASPQTNTATLRPVRVVARERSQPKNVYNLSVGGTPEYFANGILVHNCDALRYALIMDYEQRGVNVNMVGGDFL